MHLRTPLKREHVLTEEDPIENTSYPYKEKQNYIHLNINTSPISQFFILTFEFKKCTSFRITTN